MSSADPGAPPQDLPKPLRGPGGNGGLLDDDDGARRGAAARLRAARSIATRLASPEALAGVPTQMKSTSAPGTASTARPRSGGVAPRSLLEELLRPGLEERADARPSCPIFSSSSSIPTTSWPSRGQGRSREQPHVTGSDDDDSHRTPLVISHRRRVSRDAVVRCSLWE